MKTKDCNFYPPRFKTKEDAILFLENPKSFPPEKWIRPFVMLDGFIIPNKEYQDAQFEQKLIYAF